MTQALAAVPSASLTTVTPEQLDLVRRTVAKDATPDELKLYLYDCARQGVHPLDRLIHFTKRGGKYTPITSIDFMRIRAAETGEYVGNDDPVFHGTPGGPDFSATVTVRRGTSGPMAGYFTATARWSEYKPEANDFMWKKMPHTMLGKCAEALALRKGFPRQLAGLYARKEMDQADEPKGYVVEAPARDVAIPRQGERLEPAAPTVETRGTPSDDGPDLLADRDDDNLYIVRVETHDTKNPNVRKRIIVLSDGRELQTFNPALSALAENLCQDRVAVLVQTKANRLQGEELVTLVRASEVVL